jgi:hypothetical protein
MGMPASASFPAYFARLPELNRLGPTGYDSLPTMAVLTPDEMERHLAAGGVVVDARPAAAFSTGHVPGSLSNALRPVFAANVLLGVNQGLTWSTTVIMKGAMWWLRPGAPAGSSSALRSRGVTSAAC